MPLSKSLLDALKFNRKVKSYERERTALEQYEKGAGLTGWSVKATLITIPLETITKKLKEIVK